MHPLNKIKKLTVITLLLGITFNSSIHAFSRIENPEDAINKAPGFIYLAGENHADKDDIKQKKLLTHLAESGEIILALEGTDEDSSNTLFGLEELNSNSIAASLTSLMDLFRHILYKRIVNTFNSVTIDGDIINRKNYPNMFNKPKYDLNNHLKLIRTYLTTAILKKRDPEEIPFFQEQSKNNKLFKILLTTTLGQDPSIFEYLGKNQFDDNFYENMSDGHNDWYITIHRIAYYFLRQSINSSNIPSTLLIQIREAIAKCENLYTAIENSITLDELTTILDELGEIHNGIVEQIRLDLRNEIFLSKISSSYEKTQDLQKPFFAVVGARHIPFLKKQLSQKGYQVEVNDHDKELLDQFDL